MTTHFLKTWLPFFARVRNGSKRYELRKDDRGYAVGDHLILLEFDPRTETYSGRQLEVLVTDVLRNAEFGLMPGYCILSITEPLAWTA